MLSKAQKEIMDSYVDLIKGSNLNGKITNQFLKRIMKGGLSLSENESDHFTASFAAFDSYQKLVHIGHHKRSNLWMFNGGHVEKHESLLDALKREMKEEWGDNSFLRMDQKPSFLTITPVVNPGGRECKLHYGVWYFISVDSNEFNLSPYILNKEYIEAGWESLNKARRLITVPNYLLVLNEIEKNF